uniref:G_PROTEIN_RECEP_F1_2 domain-containing protein n=1 Tax=Caenorhabditis tropicalis TaxID=1561998 RepID=A0A1I7V4M2_9PELO
MPTPLVVASSTEPPRSPPQKALFLKMDASTEFEIYKEHYSRLMASINASMCQEQPDGILYCPNHTGGPVWVRNVYPPIQELQPKVLIVVVVFVLCFIVGVCGNSSIITIIRGVVEDRRKRMKRHGDNAILYIGALCVCDFVMSLSLPPAILDSVIGFWIFGTTMCKVHHVFGSVGRIASTFLITAMSFDRYVAVCYPHQHRLRSRTFVISTIVCLSAIAFVLLLPMLTYASAKEMVLHELKAHESANITRVRVFKCSDMMPGPIFYWFTSTTFILGYVVPLILIVYFNLKLINKLYAHKRVLPRSAIPVRRVVVYTMKNDIGDDGQSIMTTNGVPDLPRRSTSRGICDGATSSRSMPATSTPQWQIDPMLTRGNSDTSMVFYQDTEQTHL